MVTVQINERTKAGKVILELVKLFSKEQNGVKIIDTPKKIRPAKEYPISKNIPNKETLKAFKETEAGRGLSKPQKLDDFIKEMEKW